VNEDKVRLAHLGTTFQKVDSFWEGGFTTVDLRAFQGFSQILDGQVPNDPDFIRLNTDITFTKFVGSITRLQRMPYGLLGIVSATGQYATGRLPSSEELHIGGSGTVRGYSQGEYSGDRGYYGTFELRVPIVNTDRLAVQLAAFSDWGRAYINNPLPAEQDLRDRAIVSAGLGLRVSLAPYLRFQLDWAKYILGEAPLDDEVASQGVWYFQLVFSY
jgi:hemolysin activation/secretion protein